MWRTAANMSGSCRFSHRILDAVKPAQATDRSFGVSRRRSYSQSRVSYQVASAVEPAHAADTVSDSNDFRVRASLQLESQSP